MCNFHAHLHISMRFDACSLPAAVLLSFLFESSPLKALKRNILGCSLTQDASHHQKEFLGSRGFRKIDISLCN